MNHTTNAGFKCVSVCVAHFVSSLVTFQRAVIYPLLDPGLFHQVGGFQGEDELPDTRPEAVPVVLHDWNAVLWVEGARGERG